MNQIKTRQNAKDIKLLDKAAVASQRMKTALIRSKDQAENLLDDGQVSPSEYAEDKIQYAVEDLTDRVGHDVTSTAKKAVQKGKESYKQHREDARLRDLEERFRNYDPEFAQTASPWQSAARRSAEQRAQNRAADIRAGRNQTIKTAERTERTIKQKARAAGQKTVKVGAKGAVKSAEKTVKTAEKTSKAAIKTAEVTAKATAKAAQTAAKASHKAASVARQTAIAAYKAAVAAAKATAAAVKAIIAGVKALIAAIAAGGWVAVVVVIVICLIALIVGSCFGIFFSSEDTGSEQTMQQVVQEIHQNYQDQVDKIKAGVDYDELELSGSCATWPEVLSIYAVKTTTDATQPQEVVTMTEEKKQLLKTIFWEMNEITYKTQTSVETETIQTVDRNGHVIEKKIQKTHITLFITVSHKTAQEMALRYNFNVQQNKQLSELLSDTYRALWVNLIGTYQDANGEIIMTGAEWIPTGFFSWPLSFNGSFNSAFGYRSDPFTGKTSFHSGIDLGAAQGTPILAAASGTVIVANATDPWGYGYGYYVKIDHGNGYMTLYGHCSAIAVFTGQIVQQGQVISYMGSTGNSTGPHLHFEVYQGGTRVDPMGFFR